KLQEQPFQVLVALLENTDDIVTREDLRQKLWPGDTFGDSDHGLNNCVNKLREALSDSASSPRFIETLGRRGYRFIAPVETVGAPRIPGELRPGPKAAEAERTDRPAGYHRRALAVLGLLIALLVVVVVWNPRGLQQRVRGHGDLGPIRALAVLPLENLSGDPSQDYLAE